MPRRATTSEPTDDVTVRTERIKVKQERPKNKGKQRARIEEAMEEEDQEQQAEEDVHEDAHGEQEDGENSPRGNKRMRVNGEGASRPTNGSQQQPRMKTLPRDTDGYAFLFLILLSIKNYILFSGIFPVLLFAYNSKIL